MSDLISREDAIEALFKKCMVEGTLDEFDTEDTLRKLPSAEPEPEEFEWCHDCKEYDKEKHCCHRWTKVIRQTVEDMKNRWQWIPVSEALPEEGKSVIVCSRYGAICIVDLVKGISEETRKKMKNGEIDDPCEELWCLSDGYTMSKRSSLYKEGDEFGNNQKDYAWRNGPYHYSGQEFIAWMPLPEPYEVNNEDTR